VIAMSFTKCSAAALLIYLATGPAPAHAQTNNAPWVQIESTSLMVGIGGQGGDGQLHLPNLGTNCAYPFSISGIGAGVQVGVSRISASGPVRNLTRIEDFPGTYTSTQREATIVAGRGSISLSNNANNVSLELASQTTGIGLGLSGNRLTIDMPQPPLNSPTAYVLEFGFNKDFVNADSRKALGELMEAWKCRFVNIDVAGHTDTVGKEADNLNLAELRAQAVRNYLVGAGVVASRITTHIAGESDLRVPTANNVRLRSNRVAIVTIRQQP
jgi:outer membrane protein OmpA-like peptidoglycan-associated protein